MRLYGMLYNLETLWSILCSSLLSCSPWKEITPLTFLTGQLKGLRQSHCKLFGDTIYGCELVVICNSSLVSPLRYATLLVFYYGDETAERHFHRHSKLTAKFSAFWVYLAVYTFHTIDQVLTSLQGVANTFFHMKFKETLINLSCRLSRSSSNRTIMILFEVDFSTHFATHLEKITHKSVDMVNLN